MPRRRKEAPFLPKRLSLLYALDGKHCFLQGVTRSLLEERRRFLQCALDVKMSLKALLAFRLLCLSTPTFLIHDAASLLMPRCARAQVLLSYCMHTVTGK